MDNVTRGFHRLGLAIAVPLAIASALLLAAIIFVPEEKLALFVFAMTAAVIGWVWYEVCLGIAWIVKGFRESA